MNLGLLADVKPMASGLLAIKRVALLCRNERWAGFVPRRPSGFAPLPGRIPFQRSTGNRSSHHCVRRAVGGAV